MTASELLELARSQIGVKESPAGSNQVKYNTAYYGRAVSGGSYPWCCVFLWWLFREAGAAGLFFNGKKTAYCPALLTYHRSVGQLVSGDYRPGDIVFFNFSGNTGAAHVGLCEAWDGAYITTIDGNTGTASEANGGAVMRRRRAKKYIVGAVRPAYEEVEEVTQEQFDAMMADWMERRAKEPASKWAGPFIEEAKATGITATGDRPQSFVTREEAMAMNLAAVKAAGG